jgi:hypothetical protein
MMGSGGIARRDGATMRLAGPEVLEVALVFRWEFPDSPDDGPPGDFVWSGD